MCWKASMEISSITFTLASRARHPWQGTSTLPVTILESTKGASSEVRHRGHLKEVNFL